VVTFLRFFFENPKNMTFYVFGEVAQCTRFLEHCCGLQLVVTHNHNAITDDESTER